MRTIGISTTKRRKWLRSWIPLLCLVPGAALLPADSLGAEAECLAIEQAFAHNNVATLKNLVPSKPQWQALKQFRLAAAYIPADENKAALQAVRNGLKTVKRALQADPHDTEMLIMGAMLDGQYVLLRRWRFFLNGRRGLRRLNRAEAQQPNNPRIALVRGTAKFLLPGILGGNAKEAQATFFRALYQHPDSFAQSVLCRDGQWAQVDLLNWLARSYQENGDPEQAQATFAQALEHSPDNHWVRLAMAGEGYEWQPESGELNQNE
ncbi:MAG: tetratricopeptide repeat protein [Pseudomonadota bacterium]